jgi:hypothetical protein
VVDRRGPGDAARLILGAAVILHRVLEGFGNAEVLAWPKGARVRR